MHWIKERINKDNFWNLMFWAGMCFGLFLSVFLSEYKYLSDILFWVTIFLMPYLLIKFNKVRYAEGKIFINTEGQSLMNRLPKQLFWVIASMVLTIALTGLIMDKYWKDLSDAIAFPILLSEFLFVPTVYFIYKNCPISILFNKNAWKEEVVSMKGTFNANFSSSQQNINSTINHSNARKSPDIVNDPAYRHLSTNIYNSKR